MYNHKHHFFFYTESHKVKDHATVQNNILNFFFYKQFQDIYMLKYMD